MSRLLRKKTSISIILPITLFLLFSSCSTVGKMGINTASPAFPAIVDNVMQMDNLMVCREGLPGLIVLVSGILEFTPNNLNLLTVTSMAYTAYGLMIEDDDPEYAKSLFNKGKEYGLRALKTDKGLRKDVEEKDIRLMEAVKSLDKKYVPAIFWTSMSWASWIFHNLDDPTAPIGLPAILAMMKCVEEKDEDYFFGGAHLFYMAYNAIMPEFAGGGEKMVESSLKKALSFTDGEFMLPYVYYAKYFARPYSKREDFHEYLMKVLNHSTTKKELNLANSIAKAKAKHLLAKEEELFEYDF